MIPGNGPNDEELDEAPAAPERESVAWFDALVMGLFSPAGEVVTRLIVWRRVERLNCGVTRWQIDRTLDRLAEAGRLYAVKRRGRYSWSNVPADLAAAELFWWTYTGYKGYKGFIMAHHEESAADYHHNAAINLGGAFDAAGKTRKALTQAEAIAGLVPRLFSEVEIVNRKD